MRPFIPLKTILAFILALTLAPPALAEWEDAAGYWKLLGQQNQVPKLLNVRGTEAITILEVVGDCEEVLCSWGATRAELFYDAFGNVVRWQAFLENGEDFHEFDAFLVNGEIVMDYSAELVASGNYVSATLIFGSASEAEIAALAEENQVEDRDPVDLEPEEEIADRGEEAGADAGSGSGSGSATGSGPSLEEQIVTGGLILGGLLLLNELLDNGAEEESATPVDPDDTCGMAAIAPYMNKRYTLIPADLIKPGDRVYSDRDMITMDLNRGRLNVVYRHGNKRVFKLGCY